MIKVPHRWIKINYTLFYINDPSGSIKWGNEQENKVSRSSWMAVTRNMKTLIKMWLKTMKFRVLYPINRYFLHCNLQRTWWRLCQLKRILNLVTRYGYSIERLLLDMYLTCSLSFTDRNTTGNKGITSHVGAFVQPFLKRKSNKYYIFIVCVDSLNFQHEIVLICSKISVRNNSYSRNK
jgi:hypothetical protein